MSCLIPASRDAAACGGLVPTTSPPTYPAIEGRIVQTVDAVRARAPAARVVLVGYLTIVGRAGACAPLDLDADEAARAAAVLVALEDSSARLPGGPVPSSSRCRTSRPRTTRATTARGSTA